jgi:hypothetical protein
VTPNKDVNLEIQRRTTQTIGVRHLSGPTKFIIKKALIHPVQLYGNETWVLSKREENQLLVFESKVLRVLVSGHISFVAPSSQRREVGYRKRNNFELAREFDSSCIINDAKTNSLHYT